MVGRCGQVLMMLLQADMLCQLPASALALLFNILRHGFIA